MLRVHRRVTQKDRGRTFISSIAENIELKIVASVARRAGRARSVEIRTLAQASCQWFSADAMQPRHSSRVLRARLSPVCTRGAPRSYALRAPQTTWLRAREPSKLNARFPRVSRSRLRCSSRIKSSTARNSNSRRVRRVTCRRGAAIDPPCPRPRSQVRASAVICPGGSRRSLDLSNVSHHYQSSLYFYLFISTNSLLY